MSRNNNFIESLLGLSERIAEDKIYEEVMNEVEAGQYDSASQARAIEEASGDLEKAKALYIKHRVRRIKDALEAHRISVRKNEIDRIARNQREEDEAQKQRERAALRADALQQQWMSDFERKMFRLGRWFRKK